MELKVWVEGLQRIVSGVTETTTCQDVVSALAHASGKSGRYNLIERWRNNERELSSNEFPVKILMKWGEYSHDVQFILRRTVLHNHTKSEPLSGIDNLQNVRVHQTNDTKSDHPGSVKEIPHIMMTPEKEIKEVKKLPRKSLLRCAAAPPPYRDPPRPTAHRSSIIATGPSTRLESATNTKESNCNHNFINNNYISSTNEIMHCDQYSQLIAIVNTQKLKLALQRDNLRKCDGELSYWEEKEKEREAEMQLLAKQLVLMSSTMKLNNDQIQSLSFVEEERDVTQQLEKTLKSELTLIRSQLFNCETELLKCKNKICLLMEEIQAEMKVQSARCGESHSTHDIEHGVLLNEVEHLQKDIEAAKCRAHDHNEASEKLRSEVSALEIAIADKKRVVEQIMRDLKMANLKSFTIPRSDDAHTTNACTTLGGAKGLSMRKIVGSPRQLENAAPTYKNPHGVWV